MNYMVRPGDTLNSIAARYGVPVSELIRANRLMPPYMIYPGQVLFIPVRPGPTPEPRPPFPPETNLERRVDRLERRTDRLEQRVEDLARRVRRLEQQR
ncbi:MAG: LysM peptidoglycan-binding domain-containing protein [Brevibacillus sp.]|nr:LysM peptidoglycan-binding domain-containing protein [Brevibacillus sp.]